jgi:beta-phosphoglucomutase
MLPIKAAIFDLDGVIVDTAKYHYLAWKRLAGELGFEFSVENNERLKGVSRMQSLEIVLEVGGITTASESQKSEWANQKNEWYLESIRQMTPSEILPGVLPFINHLRCNNIKVALGSASKNAPLILENLHINNLFDEIVDGNQVAKAKPDPEVFLTAANKLKIPPSRCVVFEDAAAGIEAAHNGGMMAIGLGDPGILGKADLVISDLSKMHCASLTGETTPSEWLLIENSFSKENIELNGSKFLLGNGYMGYRGTLEEYGKEEQVACTLAGIFDRKGNAWREPVNALNGLYTVLYCDNQPLQVNHRESLEHKQILDLHQGIHYRETVFQTGSQKVSVKAERFLSLDKVHLMVMRYRFVCEETCQIAIETGIDGEVWDINGPHFKTVRYEQHDKLLTVEAVTNEGDTVVVAELSVCKDDHGETIYGDKGIFHRILIQADAGREYCFEKYVSVYTSKDDQQIKDVAVAAVYEGHNTGYDQLYIRHAQLWHERWLISDVQIDGDEEAQFALRYSIYQLLAGAPSHSAKLSVPARGLSGQTYKGAVFWDTEMFMLDFYIFTQPRLARNILQYRYYGLEGARKKAAEYGYRGAFYAWESQENGEDACTLFNVTDVFSGRPMRTYFRDKQIHISADVVYGIWRYYKMTGDSSILYDGGAEVILECARFFVSYAYFKKDKGRYEILDVTGPDEYHERVANNAFTNFLVKHCLEVALEVLELIKRENEHFYTHLLSKLHYEQEIPDIVDMCNLLYIPAPADDTKIIEQFDGYFKLEDVSLDDLRKRVKIPNEYWGGGNGLATTARIIKQADVVLLLNLFKKEYGQEVKKANWEFYEPRTEHGSSLSPCVYAMLATDIGKPDWAYPYFQKTATIDLSGDYKRYVGTLYIGGTHPAANGGAWMVAVLGFGGLHFDGSTVTIEPKLPKHWKSLSFHLVVKGQVFKVSISKDQLKIKAILENTGRILFNVGDATFEISPGQEKVFSRTKTK